MYNEIINFATREYPFLIKHISVRYIPHFHQETELVYIMKGELTFTLGMAVYTVREGDICIIPPNLIHNLYTDDYSESFVMKLYSVVDLSNIHPEKHILQCNDPGYETLRSYICGIIRENDSKEEHYRLAVNIYAEEIFLFILRNTQYHKVDSKSKLRHINESKFLDTINGYLETHYADDFSLTDIAEYLNYTKSYFCRYFKRVVGITFWEYYTLFRLEKAVVLIHASSKDTFTFIAHKSGFNNVRSFYEAFRGYYHCTPREYRKMLLK